MTWTKGISSAISSSRVLMIIRLLIGGRTSAVTTWGTVRIWGWR